MKPDNVLVTLNSGHAAVTELVATLSDEALVKPGTIGAGDWSAKDLMGHLAFWEELATESIAESRAGQKLRFWSLFAEGAGGVDGANARDQAMTQSQSLEEVRERSRRAHAAVVDAVNSLMTVEWDAMVTSPTGRSEKLGELIGGILGATDHPFGHAFQHVPELTEYVKSQRES